MSDALSTVLNIAQGAVHTAETAMPLVAQVASQASLATQDHESRIAKLEALITQWAPLVEASAAMVESAIQKPAPKTGA